MQLHGTKIRIQSSVSGSKQISLGILDASAWAELHWPCKRMAMTCRDDIAHCCAVGELEDPRRMLDQAVNDMREDVTKMRQAASQVRHLCCSSIIASTVEQTCACCHQMTCLQAL